eukprot:1816737-Rhodomonas_salina.2
MELHVIRIAVLASGSATSSSSTNRGPFAEPQLVGLQIRTALSDNSCAELPWSRVEGGESKKNFTRRRTMEMQGVLPNAPASNKHPTRFSSRHGHPGATDEEADFFVNSKGGEPSPSRKSPGQVLSTDSSAPVSPSTPNKRERRDSLSRGMQSRQGTIQNASFLARAALSPATRTIPQPQYYKDSFLSRILHSVFGIGSPTALGQFGSRLIHPASPFDMARGCLSRLFLLYVALVIQVRLLLRQCFGSSAVMAGHRAGGNRILLGALDVRSDATS